MDIRAAEISAILKEQIANFGSEAEIAEVGRVLSQSVTVLPAPTVLTKFRLVRWSNLKAASKAWR